MGKTQYEDYKYIMQDTSLIYIGAKYTYRELMENPEVSFKLKKVLENCIYKDRDPDMSIESDLYYMKKDSSVYKHYEQLRVKVKINIIEEKKSLFGKKKWGYKERTLKLKEFVDITLAKKKTTGIVVQEIILSKLALASFVI